MANYVVEDDLIRWVFGWNKRLRSFYLRKYDKTLPREESEIVRVGDRPRELFAVDDFFTLAGMIDLDIPYDMREALHTDTDERVVDYVVHFPGELVKGLRVDNRAQAELFVDALKKARPNMEPLISIVK